MAHQSFFKSDMDTRVDVRRKAVANAARDERRWNAEIDARDHRTCRACGKRTNPDEIELLRGHRAHIVYASAGGSLHPSNRLTLCIRCHQDEHRDKLRFTAEGGPYVGLDASGPLEFWRTDNEGRWYLSHREIAPGVPAHD